MNDAKNRRKNSQKLKTHLKQKESRNWVASSIISLFVSFPLPTNQLFLFVCLNGFGHHHSSSSIIISCDPPRTRPKMQQRLPSSTTTTSSSSSYYLSAPSPPSMASRSGTEGKKKRPGNEDDRLPSRWYTVLALPFPDQRLGRRDINTFGQGGIYKSRAGYFSSQAQEQRWMNRDKRDLVTNSV